jgi:signal transduction histidine kinase
VDARMPVEQGELSILLVDDDAPFCQHIVQMLHGFLFRIHEIDTTLTLAIDQVDTAEKALETIAQNEPDVVVVEHRLAGMGGLEFLRQLERKSTPLVIMVSASANFETAVAATKLGAFDFLAKPLTPAEVCQAIQKAAKQLVLSRRAREYALEKRRMRFQFLSVLSHELKSPLTAVEGYLSLLQERLEGDELRMVERSLFRVNGMRQLIMDLLDLTRIESEVKPRELSVIDLVPIIDNAVECQQHLAEEQGITFDLTIPETLPFFADPYEIEVIANNLISNAVKYNCKGGRVTVKAELKEDRFCFEVSDTGIGMSPDDQTKLFKEFSRIKNKKTRCVPGSGLGLSTVKKLVQMYHGEILLDSAPGKGSHFSVTLNGPVCEV